MYVRLWKRDRDPHNKKSRTEYHKVQGNTNHNHKHTEIDAIVQTVQSEARATTAKRVHRDSHIRVMIPTDIRIMSIMRKGQRPDWNLCAITCLGGLMRVRGRMQVTVIWVMAVEGRLMLVTVLVILV